MAELRKGTSSSVDPKENKSSLDDEFAKDFLGSWKSLSMVGDDTMDFDFDTVSIGKKEKFKFDKLDMDFNLDGDFDKLTSFKADMSDLDFSSSSKRTTEPKGSSKGDSSGSNQRKSDCFSFSFDLIEMDSFNFDSTLTDGEKVSTKKSDNKDAGAERSSFNFDSPLTEGERVSAKKSDNKDASAERRTFNFDSPLTEGERVSAKNSDNKDAGADRSSFNFDSTLIEEEKVSAKKIDNKDACADRRSLDFDPTLVEGERVSAKKLYNKDACADRRSLNFDSTLVEGEKVSAENIDKKDGADRTTFNFDSTLIERERVSAKNMDKKDAGADRTQNQGSKLNLEGGNEATYDCQTEQEKISAKHLECKDAGAGRTEHQGSKVNLVGGHEALDDCQTDELPASTPSAIDTTVGDAGTGNSSDDKFPSRAENIEDLEPSHVVQTSPQKQLSVSREEMEQQIHILENAKSAEPYAKDTIHILAVQPVDKNDFQATESDIQASSPASKVNRKSGREQNVTNRMIAVVGSNHNNSKLKIADPPQPNGSVNNRVEYEKADSEAPTGNLIETGPMLDDIDVEVTFNTALSQTRTHDFKANKDIQKSASKLLIPLRRESVVEKIRPIKEKEQKVVSSNIFLRPKDTERQLHQLSSTGVHSSSVSGGLASLSNAKRERFNGYGIQDISKLITIPRHPDKEVTKEDSPTQGSGMNVKDTTNISGSVNPSSSNDKATKSNTQTSVSSTAVVSSMGLNWNLKMESIDRLKSGKRMPDVSSLKISRTVGVSKDHSNAAVKRETSSLRNLKKDTEVQENTGSKIVHIANAERKTLLHTSLKRKTPEASIADQVQLHPQKLLSQSPSESRNLKDPLGSTAEVQCYNHDNQPASTKTISYDYPTPGLEIPNTKEYNISLTMENDGNVEKAEAYAKELEDICNLLKKKHEEAKELLVRAIVNNNSLLMLNHPMFDAKIRKVQKFAAQLVSS